MSEQRKSTSQYRDSVHCQAEYTLFLALGDYDKALVIAEECVREFEAPFWTDVLNLLRRRHDTLTAPRV